MNDTSDVKEVVELANRALDATEEAATQANSAAFWKRWGSELQDDVLAFVQEEMIRGRDPEDPLYVLGERLREEVRER